MLELLMRSGVGGFTFIEAVLVITLLAILAAALLIANPIDKLRVNGATAKLKSDVRHARKLAVTSQARSGIVFNANGYAVYHDIVAPTLANSPEEPCSSDAAGKFVVDYTAARCSELSGMTLSFTTDTVAFDPLGAPVDAAGASIPTQTITVSGPGGTRTVTIETQTGSVSD